MTPKLLLHHTKATSPVADFVNGSFFQRLIVDYHPEGPPYGAGDNTRSLTSKKKSYFVHPDKVRRVILCTGQVFYFLDTARRSRKIKDIVVVRLEQIAPFPNDLIVDCLSYYPAAEVVWVQEEPENQGAWSFVRPRLLASIPNLKLSYVGRPSSGVTATGSYKIHIKERKRLIKEALRFERC